jgi:putative Holliday junction resolvase
VRVLGIDFGESRIGLALSDPTGTLATPLATVHRRRGKRPPLGRLEEVGRERGVHRLVVGLPLDLAGNETPWCGEIRAMGDELATRLGIPVDYVDERFTSARAERAVRSIGLPKRRREEKGRVDAAAAALILQAWLDRPDRPDRPDRGNA